MDLKSRLEALRSARADLGKASVESKHKALDLGKAWKQVGEFTYHRVERLPLDTNLKKSLQEGAKYFQNGNLHSLCWFDTETTGLSGGAGTVIFLFGFLRLTEGICGLEQFFLSDFPGEEEYLRILRGSVPFLPENRFISYNGSTFDSPLLKTRFILHRLDPPVFSQLDLLHQVRRLWRTVLPDCSLRTVEQRLLHRNRISDIPGWMVPDTYFEFLKKGEPGGILKIVKHNEEDLLSLLHVFALLGALIGDPCSSRGADPVALGNVVMASDPGRGWDFFHSLACQGNPYAVVKVSRKLRLEGKFQQGEQIRAPWIREFLPVALEELKYLEHSKKDHRKALELALFWSDKDPCTGIKIDLAYRIERLKRKAARNSTS